MIGKTISHYKILEKLGEGGMGVVFKAQDLRLRRSVALKFLSPAITADAGAKERFIQEAQAASSLDHPNICTIHEINETEDGQLYIVMACYDGETLAEKIRRGALPVSAAVDITGQIARGLAKAHQKGMVHRDIKPANVLITVEGIIKILDFGLAKLAGAARITRAGWTPGTAAYMSPEQAFGGDIDQRTDIWSLGVVFYEMLAGFPPFKGEYEQALVYSIMNEEPAPLLAIRPEIPPALEQLVLKTMAKDPVLRFTDADELVDALTLCSLKSETAGRRPVPVAGQGLPSIAVLPFVNMSADPENEYFSDGLAEDIIDALTQVPGLRVMARTSAFSFRNQQTDVREIGSRLNVRHILEGSVRRSGSRIRVTAQLVTASDGYHLWSQRFDCELTDVFAIQDEISQAIVDKLRLKLTANRPLVRRHTENPAVYDLCLKARYRLLRMTPEGREAGRRYCEQAIALDPECALAQVILAESCLWRAFWGEIEPRQAFSKAKTAALEALRLDDEIADAHSALGTVLGSGEFNWQGAECEFDRALELSPSAAAIRYDYAWCYAMWYLLPQGRVEQAASEMQRALELDPLDPFYNSLLGNLLFTMRQYEQAAVQLQHTIALDPTLSFAHWFLAISWRQMGRMDEAIAAAEKANQYSGGSALTLGTLCSLYGMAGRCVEARQLLEELLGRLQSGYVPAAAFAWAYSGLGETDKALEWIERSIDQRDPTLVTALKCAPSYDRLRALPIFPVLLQRMNLEM